MENLIEMNDKSKKTEEQIALDQQKIVQDLVNKTNEFIEKAEKINGYGLITIDTSKYRVWIDRIAADYGCSPSGNKILH